MVRYVCLSALHVFYKLLFVISCFSSVLAYIFATCMFTIVNNFSHSVAISKALNYTKMCIMGNSGKFMKFSVLSNLSNMLLYARLFMLWHAIKFIIYMAMVHDSCCYCNTWVTELGNNCLGTIPQTWSLMIHSYNKQVPKVIVILQQYLLIVQSLLSCGYFIRQCLGRFLPDGCNFMLRLHSPKILSV